MNTIDDSVPDTTAFSLFSSDSGELAENPFPSLAQLRSMGAVVPLPFSFGGTGRQIWVVTRMEEVVQMLTVDELDHRRLRLLVSRAFTPRYIESLRPRVQQIADELLDRVQAQGQMDLVADYAFLLPINVIAEMLGVPHADRGQIRVWAWESASRGPGSHACLRRIDCP